MKNLLGKLHFFSFLIPFYPSSWILIPSPQITLKSEAFQVGKLKIRQLQPRLPSSKWLPTIYHLPGLRASIANKTKSRVLSRSQIQHLECDILPGSKFQTSEVNGTHGEQEMDSSVFRLKASLSSLCLPTPPSPLLVCRRGAASLGRSSHAVLNMPSRRIQQSIFLADTGQGLPQPREDAPRC